MKSLREARLVMAEIHMRDASHAGLSDLTRARTAFDAGYVWLLVALDEPSGGEHPTQDVLRAAVSRLQVPHRTIAPALAFLSQQFNPSGAKPMLAEMLEWATKMKAVAASISISTSSLPSVPASN